MIEVKQTALANLCRRFGAQKLELFGSAATDKFDRNRSDLDFIVEFPSDYDFGPWVSRLTQFKQSLEDLFDRQVDVAMASALRNTWFGREAEKTSVTVYHAP